LRKQQVLVVLEVLEVQALVSASVWVALVVMEAR